MTAVLAPPRTIARPLAATPARTLALVIAFAALTAVLAQLRIPLPGTPVPVTGQTLGVLVAGGVLGMRAGALSQALYLLVGLVGLPVFTDAGSGWEVVSGATGGYLVGFVAAAALVGWLVERGEDRHVVTSATAMLAGTAVIYVVGAAWLARTLGVPVVTADGTANAVTLGVVPFVVGDLLKITLAGTLFPAARRLLSR
jgi:biotin transport system substrate-specific component